MTPSTSNARTGLRQLRITAWVAGVLWLVPLLILAGCGGASTASCVAVPQSYPQNQPVPSGAKVSIAVGTVIWVVLIEPYKYATSPYPTRFPWMAPTSSDQAVLSSVRTCPNHDAYSLSLTIHAFRATGTGQATLTSPLRAPWRGRASAIRAYRATVVVR